MLLINCFFSSTYVLPSMLLRMGFSSWRTGVLMSVFYGAAFLARPLASWLVERLGVKGSVLLSTAFGAAAGAAMLSRDFGVLVASRAGLGVAASVFYVAAMAYQGLAITAAERGRVMGLLTLASMTPQLFLVPLSEYLIDGGFERVYLLLPTLVLLVSAAFALTLSPGAGTAAVKKEGEWGTWGELLSRRDTWALCASMFMVTLTATGVCQYMPTLMRSLGLRAAALTTTFSPTSVAIRLTICAWVMTKFDRRRTFSLFATIEAISLMLGARSAATSGFICAGVLFGISHGLNYPAVSALLPDVVPPRLMPKGASLFLLVHDLPPFLLPLFIGAAPASVGLGGVLFATGVLGAVAFPLIYVFLWRPGIVGKAGESA
jgi:MFS family permease